MLKLLVIFFVGLIILNILFKVLAVAAVLAIKITLALVVIGAIVAVLGYFKTKKTMSP